MLHLLYEDILVFIFEWSQLSDASKHIRQVLITSGVFAQHHIPLVSCETETVALHFHMLITVIHLV